MGFVLILIYLSYFIIILFFLAKNVHKNAVFSVERATHLAMGEKICSGIFSLKVQVFFFLLRSVLMLEKDSEQHLRHPVHPYQQTLTPLLCILQWIK